MANEHLGILGCYLGAPVASLHSTTTERMLCILDYVFNCYDHA